MVQKRVTESKFKRAKLDKTKGRREALARERRLADLGGLRRNDRLHELTLIDVEIADLRPPARRVRKTSPEHVETVAASIADAQFVLPVLVREGVVFDGWTRVLAVKELGYGTIQAINCDHLSEPKARALAIALNRMPERGAWDLDELRIEFRDLIDLEVNVETLGFTSQERDIIDLDALDGRSDDADDDVPELPETPVTQHADVWLAGQHKVLCADSRFKSNFEALMLGETAHAALVDFPYNVKIEGNVSGLGKKVHCEFAMASGEMSDPEFETFLATGLAHLKSFSVPGAVLFGFMDWRGIGILYAAGAKAGLNLINLVVWYKQSGGMGGFYRSANELVAVFCKGKTPACNNVRLGSHGRDRCNVVEAPGANRRGSSANEMLGSHATPKPVSICEDFILDVTDRGNIVLDVFLGSGTTLIAAEKTGRRCFGMEIEPRFVDLTVRRWEKLTGKEATLAETGETFTEVKVRRERESASPSNNEGDAK